MVKKSVYTTNLSEVDDAEPEIDGLQSSLVQIPSLEHREKQMKQFANALKTLRLEPYVHSSQLTQFVAADPLRNHLGSGQSEAKEEDSKDAMGECNAPPKRSSRSFMLTTSRSREGRMASTGDARQRRLQLAVVGLMMCDSCATKMCGLGMFGYR